MNAAFTTTPQSMSRVGRLGTPFAVLMARLDATPDGHFRPGSFVVFTESLRASGILAELAPDSLRDLLLLLTFAKPDGDCLATADGFAAALGVTESEGRSRLKRLADIRWRGAPVAASLKSPPGVETYRPSPTVLGLLGELDVKEEERRLDYRPAGRAAVTAYSRAQYARPRAEVERQIAEMNGWTDPETAQGIVTSDDVLDRDALRRLGRFGVPDARANELVRRYGAKRVIKQAEWIRYRKARRPVAMLIASIERDFGEPEALKIRNPLPPRAPDGTASSS
ncbi:MAG TPA: hypothetical protein VGM51_07160 [Armatimonadota bacterium]|jgi:hypothetical protein